MRVFVVDSQPVFREGLKSIIEAANDLRVVGESSTYRDVLDEAKHSDLLILDGEMDSLAFLDSLDKARRKGSPPYVLVLTREIAEQHAIQLVAAGADGYMYKTETPDIVLNAIRKVARGGKYIPNALAEKMVFAMNGVTGKHQLSQREYQVLYLIASGMSATEIAEYLSLSVKTISTYRCRILEKLQLKNNAELMKYALKKGMAA
jgi:DNA-binding NarL/FixJ family response regulator